MEVKKLLEKSKEIWGSERMLLPQIIVRLGKVFGDICRWERNANKDESIHSDDELKKEFGNMIFSSIKFCNELGYDPEECIQLAIDAQIKFVKEKERH
jgi:uncharacterized protein YabN with tetrapyrrole methylase and pyrophosphatase domain